MPEDNVDQPPEGTEAIPVRASLKPLRKMIIGFLIKWRSGERVSAELLRRFTDMTRTDRE